MSDVKLVAITQPRVDGINSAEEFVAYTARVSNPTAQINNETAPRLLRYLMKHKHWSPLEQVSMTFEIHTTRDIGRQILRHRSFVFQEFSQRYAEVTDQFEVREARLQDHKNRQNSIEVDDPALNRKWEEWQAIVAKQAKQAYEWALNNGIAKEQARSVMPEGMTKSTLYMTGSLRSFVHYCQLRCGVETQKEHREIADKVWELIAKEFPSIAELIKETA